MNMKSCLFIFVAECVGHCGRSKVVDVARHSAVLSKTVSGNEVCVAGNSSNEKPEINLELQ